MTAPVPVALPYGMRDCKIYPYEDEQGTILSATGFDLPNMQTFSFADAEEYTDLRGDDELVATHGNGAQVNWSLEAGGMALSLWAIFTGGQIIESGAAPNRLITLRKLSDDARPYFRIDGQIVSDSGGDVVARVYRAKCNGDISGQFADGQFFVTAADGVGLPMPGSKLLYDIIQHEHRGFLSTTPEANPIMPPRNIVIGAVTTTGATVQWEAVTGATAYVLQTSDDDGATWDAVAGDPTDPEKALTGLTINTDYLVHIKTKVGTDTGAYSEPVAFSTLAA